LHQVFDIACPRQIFLDQLRGHGMFFIYHFGHDSADTLKYVDRGEMTARSETTREPYVPVQNPANGISDGVMEIVAFDEYRVETGNRPLYSGACSLENLWK